MRSLVIALFVSFLVGMPLAADSPSSRVRIEVKDLNGKPVDRASVVVRFFEGRSVIKLGKKNKTTWETRTNQEGVARLPSMPQGKIRVQVIAKGFQTFGDTFEVSQPEQTIEVKLNPPQQQYSAHE